MIMERLTKLYDGFYYGISGVTREEALSSKHYRGEFECTGIVETLAEYENTGFTPTEVEEMQKELDEYKEEGTIDEVRMVTYNKKRYNDEEYDFCGEYGNSECSLKEKYEQMQKENAELKEFLKLAIGEIKHECSNCSKYDEQLICVHRENCECYNGIYSNNWQWKHQD